MLLHSADQLATFVFANPDACKYRNILLMSEICMFLSFGSVGLMDCGVRASMTTIYSGIEEKFSGFGLLTSY